MFKIKNVDFYQGEIMIVISLEEKANEIIQFLEKYDKDNVGIIKSIKYMVPYALIILAMWIVLLLLWYVIGIPLGLSSSSVL